MRQFVAYSPFAEKKYEYLITVSKSDDIVFFALIRIYYMNVLWRSTLFHTLLNTINEALAQWPDAIGLFNQFTQGC